MGRLGFISAFVGLSLAAMIAGSGCAKGSEFGGTKAGGTGGSDGGAGAGGSAGQGAGAGTAGTGTAGTGNGGTAGTGNGGTAGTGGDTSTTSSTGTTTSTTTTTTTTTDTGCPAGEHECSGQCFGNTPQSGCLQSVSCTPCAQPANGTSLCTAAGACDFTCAAPFVKQGAVCACPNACCADADCNAGETCVSGTCMSAMTCDQQACTASCIAQCIFMMKVGLGLCINNMCNCTCM